MWVGAVCTKSGVWDRMVKRGRVGIVGNTMYPCTILASLSTPDSSDMDVLLMLCWASAPVFIDISHTIGPIS